MRLKQAIRGVIVAGRRRNSGSGGFLTKTFFMFVFIAAIAAAGYLYYQNSLLRKQLKTDNSRVPASTSGNTSNNARTKTLEKENESLKAEIKRLATRIKEHEDTIAELKLQAVIKGSENP